MTQTERGLQTFSINREAVGKNPVALVANTDTMVVLAHVWQDGGETALHSHHSSDAAWVVLDGEVTFYGEGDVELARLARGNGILIPRGVKYWFRKMGTGELVMARCAANSSGVLDDRVHADSQA